VARARRERRDGDAGKRFDMTTTGAISRSPPWNDTRVTLASFDRVA
jgi:hypothetical protein